MIRYGEEKDIEIAKNIWKENFTDSNEEINFYFKNIYKKENFLVLEEENKIKASLHENPYIINLRDNLLPSFYIVAVAVSPEYRKKGYMKKLLTYSLKNGRNSNKDIIFLSPINSEIYSKFGFGYISGLENYNIKIENIPFNSIDKDIDITKVEENNFKDLIKIYNNKMKSYNLFLFRDNNYFSRIKKELENENGKIYIFSKNNKALGYLMCYFKDDEIFIREFFYTTIECSKNMLAFIKTFKEYYHNLKVTLPQKNNFNFIFPNQLKIEKNETPYIMGRILNVKNILSLLKIQNLDFKIKINDSIIEENNQFFSIDSNGIVKKVKSTEDWNINIDISDFVSLITGYLDVEELLELEKISIKNIDLNSLSKIFIKQKNYIQEYQ